MSSVIKANSKVTIIDDAFDPILLQNFIKSIDKKKFIEVGYESGIDVKTDFSIMFYKDEFHTNVKYDLIRREIYSMLRKYTDRKIPSPRVMRNCMLKYNKIGQRSALHVENEKIHGNLGYLLYLSNETSGHVEWVDAEGEKEYFNKHPEEKEKFFMDHPQRKLYDPLKVKPRFNRLVIFETLGAHRVHELTESNNELPRLTIMGWPYCAI
jgi:hypothetical protein